MAKQQLTIAFHGAALPGISEQDFTARYQCAFGQLSPADRAAVPIALAQASFRASLMSETRLKLTSLPSAADGDQEWPALWRHVYRDYSGQRQTMDAVAEGDFENMLLAAELTTPLTPIASVEKHCIQLQQTFNQWRTAIDDFYCPSAHHVMLMLRVCHQPLPDAASFTPSPTTSTDVVSVASVSPSPNSSCAFVLGFFFFVCAGAESWVEPPRRSSRKPTPSSSALSLPGEDDDDDDDEPMPTKYRAAGHGTARTRVRVRVAERYGGSQVSRSAAVESHSGALPAQTTRLPDGKREGLPREAVVILQAWTKAHFVHPYPTSEEKQQLADQAGVTASQVN